MATLILSTVGTALGGPVGAAIGALIGQSIDQQILGPATRGPRLGDLSVQTSSYGTQVPRIYGRMRVAGSVIWSTDLVESSETTGAKGQPDTTFSYKVSFAVALSSRPIIDVGRIWADGKLIRDAAGEFTATTVFRLHDGSEAQDVDPLIASIEGIGTTPAYRGLALAVFENLELADFGNRIPFLTFEVIADDEDPAIAAILDDASRGAIAADASDSVIGYAAYGQSMRAAAGPLVETFGLGLFDDGTVVRGALTNVLVAVADDELGNSADGERVARIQREQSPVRAVPAALRLAFYDPDRDYQSGEARASAGEQGGAERSTELAAVVDASSAKAIVNRSLARSWAQRDRLTLRLSPKFLALEPGTRLEVPLSPAEWIIESCTIEGLVAVVGLRAAAQAEVALEGQGGRITANASAPQGALTLALFDAPELFGTSATSPSLLLAASTATPGWRRRAVQVDVGGQSFGFRLPARKSVLGAAIAALAPGDPHLIDAVNSVEIQLIDADQWLTSCEDAALANGANLALLGRELIQFGEAVPTGAGRFRLARLLRGRGGTEWAMAAHQAAEPFALASADQLTALILPPWTIGASASISPVGAAGASVVAPVGGEGLRPPAPVGLQAAFEAEGALSLRWIRRSRDGWAWRDEVEVPLGESAEAYVVNITGSAGSLDFSCFETQLAIAPAELADAGPGPALVAVRQIGDFAASRPATLSITLP